MCKETHRQILWGSKALGKVRTRHLAAGRFSSLDSSLRNQGPGLLFELPEDGSQEKEEYIREDLRGQTCYSSSHTQGN